MNRKYKGNHNEDPFPSFSVFFQQGRLHTFTPRAICVDLEASTIEGIRDGDLGGLFRPDSFVYDDSSASGNFAKGFLSEGAELCDMALDRIRREMETCDSVQGFQILHSIAGGCGSGCGSLILNRLRDEYRNKLLMTYTVLPSQRKADRVVEPYNAVMALSYLVEFADMSVCVDNDALFDTCRRNLKIDQPSYQNLDGIISNVISGKQTKN